MGSASSTWVPGAEIPSVRRAVNPVALFAYSAVTWNPHRIHYDREYTLGLDHDDLVVPGALQADWIVQCVEQAFGEAARIRSLSFRAVSPAYMDREFEVGGTVTRVLGADSSTVDGLRGLEVATWIRSGPDEVTMEATVGVDLPTDPGH